MKARVPNNNNDIFDFSGRCSAERTMINSWKSFRDDLANEIFQYDDMINAKKNLFFKEFDETFNFDNGYSYIEKQLSDICESNYLGRGCKLKPNEEYPDYDRFFPKSECIIDDNRFSPKGVEWLYLSLGTSKNELGMKDSKLCSQAECGVKKGDRFAFCQFDSEKNGRIADLTIGMEKSFYRINRELKDATQKIINEEVSGYIRQFKNPDSSKIAPVINTWRILTYCKILSEQIFVPVDSTKKSLMYAPFHCIAQYFLSLGYSGIIYKSTVYDKSKNLVLFDKLLAHPVGDIQVYNIE